jgi:RES domain-containing protein
VVYFLSALVVYFYFALDSRPLVVDAGPGKELFGLYRARVFQSELKLKHALEHRDLELGPPPTKAAANGRMNALGVSVFYGATDYATALAEVRPPVGSKVLVGRFEIILPLRLLDVEALRSLMVEGSVFDHNYIGRLRRAKFLEGLSHRVTKPVMPDDEPFEYLATQAIADFLATESNPPLDGLIYPSIQADAGVNVVLFHKAARVAPLDIPPGATVSADLTRYSDDGADADYWVWEEIPPVATAEPSASSDFPLINARWTFEPDEYDERTPTLRLDVTSLEVHHIDRVAFATSTYSVHHHRSEKRPLSF